jgi:hypothetical protein
VEEIMATQQEVQVQQKREVEKDRESTIPAAASRPITGASVLMKCVSSPS